MMQIRRHVLTFERVAHFGHKVGVRPGPGRKFHLLHSLAGSLTHAKIDTSIVGEEIAREATQRSDKRWSVTRFLLACARVKRAKRPCGGRFLKDQRKSEKKGEKKK